jgi:hypothetical protein
LFLVGWWTACTCGKRHRQQQKLIHFRLSLLTNCARFNVACRVKMLLTTAKPHNQVDAEVAAGMGRPDNGPKLRSSGPADMEMLH